MVIRRFRGDTYPIIGVLKDDCEPINLTSASVTFTIGYDVPVSIDGIILDAVNGKVQFNIEESHVDTEGFWDYDIELTTSTGQIITYAKDVFAIDADVTP